MSEYVEYLADALQGFGSVRIRKMFGGYGVFHDSIMFALVADDTLYLKADAESAPRFESRGLKPFQYPKGKRLVTMSYFMAPEEVLDDPVELWDWARIAYAAALRARA